MDLFGQTTERPTEIERDAVLSDCGLYRYLLRRVWDRTKPIALVCMLNPSTADAYVDDATIRSLIRLFTALGYGGFEVVNLYAWRATDPKELAKAADPVGPRNDAILEAAIGRCDVIVCAWGAHSMAAGRAQRVYEIASSRRPAVFCFGTTKAGHPKHPLYIKTGTTLEVWRPTHHAIHV